jgi:hypothetical protein
MWWSSTPPGGSQQAWETSLPGVSLLLLARAAGTIQTSRRTSPSNVQRMTWPGPVEPERPVNPQSMPLSSPVWRIAARRRRTGLRQPAGSGARRHDQEREHSAGGQSGQAADRECDERPDGLAWLRNVEDGTLPRDREGCCCRPPRTAPSSRQSAPHRAGPDALLPHGPESAPFGCTVGTRSA